MDKYKNKENTFENLFSNLIGSYTRTSFFIYYLSSFILINFKAIYLTLFVSEEYIWKEFEATKFTLFEDLYGYSIFYLPNLETFLRTLFYPLIFSLIMIFIFQRFLNYVFEIEISQKNHREEVKLEKLLKPRKERSDRLIEYLKTKEKVLDLELDVNKKESTIKKQLSDLDRLLDTLPKISIKYLQKLLESSMDPRGVIPTDSNFGDNEDLVNYLFANGYLEPKEDKDKYNQYNYFITEPGKALYSQLLKEKK